ENHQQKKITSKIYQEIPPHVSELLVKWENEIEKLENDFKIVTVRIEKSFKKAHLPHLIKKVDLFINQNIEAVNNLLEGFKDTAMNQLQINFERSNEEILEMLIAQNNNITKEFNNIEKHIQLVFTRYRDYPINEKKQMWDKEFKKVKNQLNDIKNKVINFLEIKADMNRAIDCYYEIAKPVYGYKVQIKEISGKLDIPEDKLEKLFVELISNNLMSGEIDPVTKVIVLSPRTIDRKSTQKVKTIRCMVCNLIIYPSREEIIHCPHCYSPAHQSHLVEWVKIKGFCPKCKSKIKII
ncbi:MAG: PCI domain-containing protein, partial [Promethearchaeota archaeon]